MLLLNSCLRRNYRCCTRLNYYRAYCSVRRALNEKCTATKLISPNEGYIFQKYFFNCSFSSRRMFTILRKHEVRKARLFGNRLYSQGNQNPTFWKIICTIFVFIALDWIFRLPFSHVLITIDMEEFFRNFLSRGAVEKLIVLDDDMIRVVVRDDAVIPYPQPSRSLFILKVDNVIEFEDYLREEEDTMGITASDRIQIIYERAHSRAAYGLILFWIIVASLLFRKSFNWKKYNPFTPMKRAPFTLIDPFTGGTKGVKFSDVAGLKEAKQEIMEFVDYLKRPNHYQELGAKVPKGALLLGPPGCGKTLLAKAVASEANVPFLSINGSEFVELIGGLGAARVRNLFSEAKKISPCIIYIDEIDTIGKKRASSSRFSVGSNESEHTLNQLLVEMDGMASREGVITLASTNRAGILDRALLRPGRFDRHIVIDLPSAEERREIFMQYLGRIRLEKLPENYARRLASLTPGFSGADIANICNEAALYAARFKKEIVTGKDLEYAVDKVVGGVEKFSSVVAPDEKKLIAYHEAGRALVGWLSDGGEILLKISIVPRTNQSTGWSQFSQPERLLFSQDELFDKMCMSLGGRAAETLIFNKISTKSERDLKKITKIAYATISRYGMNDILGPISFGAVEEYERKPYSKQLSALIDEEARKLISKAFQQAEVILRANKDLLIKLAEELLKRETLTYKDVEALIGLPKNSKKKIVEPLIFELSINVAAEPGQAAP